MKPRIPKLNLKSEVEIRELLERILESDEEIVSAFFVLPWLWSRFEDSRLLFLTSRQIVVVRTGRKDKILGPLWSIPCNGVQRIQQSWLGSGIRLVLRDGRRVLFCNFEGKSLVDGEKITFRYVHDLILSLQSKDEMSIQWEEWRECLQNRCVHCCSPMARDKYQCDQCQAKYWRPGEVFKRMLILPFLGFRSLGNMSLAWMGMIGDVMILTELRSSFEHGGWLGCFWVLCALCVVHVVLGIIGYSIARGGMYPVVRP